MKKVLFMILALTVAVVTVASAVSCSISLKKGSESTAAETETGTDAPDDNATSAEDSSVTTEAEKTSAEETTEPETEAVTEPETEPAQSNDAYLIYKTAAEKTNAMPDLNQDQNIDQEITMTMLGQTVKTHSVTSTNLQVQNRHENDFKYRIDQTVSSESNGQTQTSQALIFADKDNLYVKYALSDGFQVISRSDPSAQTINEWLTSENMTAMVLSEKSLANAAVTENGDGTKTISGKPEPGAVDNDLENMKAQLQTTFAAMGAENVDFSLSSIEYTFTVSQDGYIVRGESVMTINLTMKISGVPVSATSVATSVVDTLDPGQPVNVEIPSV